MKIQRVIVERIIAHAQADAPIEACGYLGEKAGIVGAAYPMKNADASPEHFSFVPTEQFAVVRQIRDAGERLRAVYHSHPASPARPSQEDIRLAFDPELSYVIVSLAEAQPVVKSFRIREGQVAVEDLQIVES